MTAGGVDPRVEALKDRFAEWYVYKLLELTDTADRQAGIVRVRVDANTVERVAREIDPMPFSEREATPHDEKRRTMARIRARAVLAILTGDQP